MGHLGWQVQALARLTNRFNHCLLFLITAHALVGGCTSFVWRVPRARQARVAGSFARGWWYKVLRVVRLLSVFPLFAHTFTCILLLPVYS